jgi:hypothetical protein
VLSHYLGAEPVAASASASLHSPRLLA